jgi:hypothetical protein
MYRWLDHTDAAGDLARPDLTDPTLLAASGLINATESAAYFAGDLGTVAWLGLEALRICVEHGPASALINPSPATWPTAPGAGRSRPSGTCCSRS